MPLTQGSRGPKVEGLTVEMEYFPSSEAGDHGPWRHIQLPACLVTALKLRMVPIFSNAEEKSKEGFMTCENDTKFKLRCPYIQLRGNKITPSFAYVATGAELCSCDRDAGPSTPKDLLSGSFPKTLGDP